MKNLWQEILIRRVKYDDSLPRDKTRPLNRNLSKGFKVAIWIFIALLGFRKLLSKLSSGDLFKLWVKLDDALCLKFKTTTLWLTLKLKDRNQEAQN